MSMMPVEVMFAAPATSRLPTWTCGPYIVTAVLSARRIPGTTARLLVWTDGQVSAPPVTLTLAAVMVPLTVAFTASNEKVVTSLTVTDAPWNWFAPPVARKAPARKMPV